MSGRNNRIVRNRERGMEFNKNKTIMGVAIFVVAIIIIVVMIFSLKNRKKLSFNSSLGKNITYEYFLLSTEEKLGIIDKKGNIVIDAKYDEIDIPNPSEDVFICIKDDEKNKILDKDNNEIFKEYENVQAVKSSEESNQVEKHVLKYKKGDLYGLMDIEGNVLTNAIYNEISSLDYRPGKILVKKDEKYGILDENGNIFIEIEYDNISSDGFITNENSYQDTGFIISKKAKDGINFGYINSEGEKILDVKYEQLERALEYNENDIYLIAMQKGKKGVFKNKKKIIDMNFQDINYSDLSNVFIVNKNGKYGFYNLSGKAILKPEYTTYSIAGNYISVEKDGKNKLFDIHGNLVNTKSYKKMIETENPAYFIAEDEDGNYSIISKEVNIDEKYSQISYAFDNYFIVTNSVGKSGVINAITNEVEIKLIYDFIILIEGTKTLQAVDGVNNYIDIYSSNLSKTVTMEDAIVENLENGYSIIYSEKDMKYINKNGEVVESTEVYPDSKIFATQKNMKWGFMDSNKKEIIPCEYDIVTEFNEYGFAGIKKDGKWGVVDKEGNIILEPTYELDTYYFPKFIGKYLLIQSEITYCEDVI